MSSMSPTDFRTERQLLEQRARKMKLVTRALRERARQRHSVGAGPPAPLLEAIAGFDRELANIRRRLDQLRGPWPVRHGDRQP
jgi:hypothetical protein